MKKNNPYPGITRVVDRHGKVRWRFRQVGKPSCYIVGEYASKDFECAYNIALDGKTLKRHRQAKAKYGTFDWLIEKYCTSMDWIRIGTTFKKNLGNQIERFRIAHGNRLIADLKREHVEFAVGRKASTPSAANELLKLFGRLLRFAIRLDIITVDVSRYVKPLPVNPDGYYTWTDDDIEVFENAYSGKAILALRLMLYTGAARQDVITFGWQNISKGRLKYRRIKTGGNVDLPILPQLLEVLQDVPEDQFLFLVHGENNSSYKPETFGNWFNGLCKKAGLMQCSAHGLRKAGATRLANAQGTENEIASFLGHKSTDEAKTYTKKANRVKLADSAMKKIETLSNPVIRLDNWKRK